MARRLYDVGVIQQRAREWFRVSSALYVVGGLAVFLGVLWTLGIEATWTEVRKVGWFFPAIVALGGLRFLVRAAAWVICLEPPHRLRLRDAFAAVLAGDALGNLTPLGPLVGEPAKATFARRYVAGQPALTALAVENILYTLATAAMIAAGMIALLFTFDLPAQIREFSEIAIAGLGLLIAISLLVLWRRPAILSRWIPLAPGAPSDSRVSRLRTLEHDIYSFASRRPGALIPAILLEVGFHALGVLETHLTLSSLGTSPSLMTSFIFETASRLLIVAFKVVPFQLGVAEVGMVAFAPLVGMDKTIGFAFSLIRKARVVVWALIGGALLVRSGVTPPSPQSSVES